MTTGRLEAFSDGVFAIAITLLVLDIHVPAPGSGDLAHELAARWPSYAAYAISFMTIGVIWINHHIAVQRLGRVDHGVVVWNLLLLMTVGILPFTTSLMATYLREGEHLAAIVYGGSFLVMSLVFAATNRHILFTRPDLLRVDLDATSRRRILLRGLFGSFPYLLATALGLASPYATLLVCGGTAVFYTLPTARADDEP